MNIIIIVLFNIIIIINFSLFKKHSKNVRGKIMCFSLDKFSVFYGCAVQVYFSDFDLVPVFCSFFDSTGWAVKNDERIVLFKFYLL